MIRYNVQLLHWFGLCKAAAEKCTLVWPGINGRMITFLFFLFWNSDLHSLLQPGSLLLVASFTATSFLFKASFCLKWTPLGEADSLHYGHSVDYFPHSPPWFNASTSPKLTPYATSASPDPHHSPPPPLPLRPHTLTTSPRAWPASALVNLPTAAPFNYLSGSAG